MIVFDIADCTQAVEFYRFPALRDSVLSAFGQWVRGMIEVECSGGDIILSSSDSMRLLFCITDGMARGRTTLFEADVDYMRPLVGLVMRLCGYPADPTFFISSPIIEGSFKVRDTSSITIIDAFILSGTSPSVSLKISGRTTKLMQI